MIVDQPLEDGAEIECDLCVVGAGAAGITLAREFVDSSVKVCVVESGGVDYEPEVQDLYDGPSVGHPYDLASSRLRYFGGTTNHWSGFCKPMSALALQDRPWVPYSGWPVTMADLLPFYRRAQPICELGDFVYDERLWAELDAEPARLDPDALEFSFWQHSPPTRFGDLYRVSLDRARNIRVLLHASVANVQTNEASSAVEHLDLRSLQGATGRIRARCYVLACGAIENARLLLLSDNVEANGVGNRHDLVGRFFMEHVHVDCEALIAADQMASIHIYLPHHREKGLFSPSFECAPAMQRRERVLGCQARLLTSSRGNPGLRAATKVWRDVEDGRLPDNLASSISTIIGDLDDIAHYAYRRFVVRRQPYLPIDDAFFELLLEQAPNPDSRVTLADEQDALGLRRARLDWRLTDFERRSVATFIETLGAELARLNIGRLRVPEWLRDDSSSWPPDLQPGYHHMGTTRMAIDPKQGVVDQDSRVHEIDNLYIAGSSVFPTGGHGTPTLTIVALAIRLSEHLKGRLAG